MKNSLRPLEFMSGPYSVYQDKTCPFCGDDSAFFIVDSFGVVVEIICEFCGYEKDMTEDITLN